MPSETTCFCELFVGFRDVALLSLRSQDDGSLVMRFETKPMLVGCPVCGSIAESKGRAPVPLIDLQCFGRATTSIWVKRRYVCGDPDCEMGSWTEVDDEIAPKRSSMTTRAARATEQVGRMARSVSELAKELRCDWHTVNDNVVDFGNALLDQDSARVGLVSALGTTRCSSRGSATTAVSTSRRPSWTWRRASSWTSCLVVAVSSPHSGSRQEGQRGDHRCASRRATSRVPIGPCSKRCCPTRSSWPIPFT